MDSEVRDSVIARDRGLCVWCSAVGGEIHHRRVKGMGGGSIEDLIRRAENRRLSVEQGASSGKCCELHLDGE